MIMYTQVFITQVLKTAMSLAWETVFIWVEATFLSVLHCIMYAFVLNSKHFF